MDGVIEAIVPHLLSQALPHTENEAVVEIPAARLSSKIQFFVLGHCQRQVVVCCASIKCPPVCWRPVRIDIVQVKQFVMDTDRIRKAVVKVEPQIV